MEKKERGRGRGAYTLYIIYATSLNETKKGGETSKSKMNIGMANMHKKYRRQDRDPGWLGHRLAR